jgi:hypothetical protein
MEHIFSLANRDSRDVFVPPHGYTLLGEHSFLLPLEQFKCEALYRRRVPLTEVEAVVLGFVSYCGGIVDRAELGVALGLAVEDIPGTRIYRDVAECALLDGWLGSLIKFELLEASASPSSEPEVALTEAGELALQLGFRYSYFTAEAYFYQLRELSHEPELRFIELNKPALLRDEKAVTSRAVLATHCTESAFEASVRHQLEHAGLLSEADVLAVGEVRRTISDSVMTTGQFYRNSYLGAYAVTASVGEAVIAGLSAILQSNKNAGFLSRIAHDCEFELFWNNPASQIDLNALLRFSDKWSPSALLPDPRLQWEGEGVLEYLLAEIDVSYCSMLTELIPVALLEQLLAQYVPMWNWHVASERLSDNFILTNTLAGSGASLLYRWDYAVLSQRSINWVISVLDVQLASPLSYLLADPEPFSWDWSAISSAAPTDYILSTLLLLPYDRHQLARRDKDFVALAIVKELLSGVVGGWKWHQLQREVLPLDFFWKHLPQLGKVVDWNDLAVGLLSKASTPVHGFDRQEFIRQLKSHSQDVYPFTDEDLAWDISLVAELDQAELLRWESNTLSDGFELNQHVEWSRDYFARFHSRVKTAKGQSIVSGRIVEVTLLAEYPGFAWDWQAVSANAELKWSKPLTAQFAQQIVWSALLGQYKPAAKLTPRMDALHEQAISLGKSVASDVWAYFNAHLPVEDLLARCKRYEPWVDLPMLCARDAEAVASYLLASEDFSSQWDWHALSQQLSPAAIVPLVEKLNRYFIRSADENVLAFARSITVQLPIETQLYYAQNTSLAWNWHYLTQHITREQALEYADRFKDQLDWTYLTRNTLTKEDTIGKLSQHPEIVQLLDWEFILQSSVESDEILTGLQNFASIVNVLTNKGVSTACWSVITKRLPIDSVFQQLPVTAVRGRSIVVRDRVLRFDWTYLSNTPKLHSYLTLGFVRKYKDCWDWKSLSQNIYLNKTHSYLLDSELRYRWDWEYLSEFGQFIRPGKYEDLRRLYKKFEDHIRWNCLSRRANWRFEGELLLEYESKEWDWALVAAAPLLDISDDQLFQLQDKEWDWKALSFNKGAKLTIELVIELREKPWDWQALSSHPQCVPSVDAFGAVVNMPWDFACLCRREDVEWTPALLDMVADKGVDWTFLSGTAKIKWTMDLLRVHGHRLDWQIFSKTTRLPLSAEFVSIFRDRWDFASLSRSTGLRADLDILTQNADASWDWKHLSSRSDLEFTSKHLSMLASRLHWGALARRQWGHFPVSWLQEFSTYWDIIELSQNWSLPEPVKREVQRTIEANPSLNFLLMLEQQQSVWKGNIYHYTHLSNAVEIIREGAIVSRNRMQKSNRALADAAGSVVHRRGEAHDYARFYFRPQTPTQFYNECLGIESDNDYFYSRAQRLGLPKCPIPVFFRFKLQEVLAKYSDTCRISDGNMQTNHARIGTLAEIIPRFNARQVYLTSSRAIKERRLDEYLKYSQQEFLVREALPMGDMSSMTILVQSQSDKNVLLSLIGETHPMASKIQIDFGEGIFHGNNKRVHTNYSNLSLEVSTEFCDAHELIIETDSPSQIKSIEGSSFKQKGGKIAAQNFVSVTFQSDVPFTVSFWDTKRDAYLLYKNKGLQVASPMDS